MVFCHYSQFFQSWSKIQNVRGDASVFVVLQTASFSKQHNAWIVILMLLPYQNKILMFLLHPNTNFATISNKFSYILMAPMAFGHKQIKTLKLSLCIIKHHTIQAHGGVYFCSMHSCNLGRRYMVTTFNPGSFTPREWPLTPIGCKAGWDPSQFGCFCQVSLVIRGTDPWFPNHLVCSLVTILKVPLSINVRTKPLHKHYSWANKKLLSSEQN